MHRATAAFFLPLVLLTTTMGQPHASLPSRQVTGSAGSNSAKNENRADLAHHDDKNSETPSCFIAINNQAPAPNAQASDTQSPDWYTRPDWWLAIFGFPTLVFVGAQAWLMRQHAMHLEQLANAASDNAAAARLNAQAIINSERPWIAMVIKRDNRLPNFFRLIAENRGRTPAAIVSVKAGCAEVGNSSDLPSIPVYSKSKEFNEPLLLIQGEPQGMHDLSPDCVREGYFPGVTDWKKIGFIFGSVCYRDLLDTRDAPHHETRWCCKLAVRLDGEIDADELYLIQGPEGYTKYT